MQSQQIFPTIEVSEIIPYRYEKPYEDVSFLTDLYLKKGWSLRRISKELDCCKATVRKKLVGSGVEIAQNKNTYEALRQKVAELRKKGKSFNEIAAIFNLWRISTRSGEGKWYPKTIRELDDAVSRN